ncbi:MAG: GbsR/MarR family transcriptional regulator [Chitinophagales bacterium]|jgi:DNA-binding transcriptional regulator GbsR (MarR family)
MDFKEGKEKFIESWGKMASDWGINRTMAQVHALLLIAPDALTADEVMAELNISRGNANMTLRALMDWGLVHKQLKSGERKEYFFAEKDMWVVVRQIIIHRKKRELEPMLKVLEELSTVKGVDLESETFSRVISDIKLFSNKANQTLDVLTRSDSNWFTNVFLRFLK